jgi:hypothetical protein
MRVVEIGASHVVGEGAERTEARLVQGGGGGEPSSFPPRDACDGGAAMRTTVSAPAETILPLSSPLHGVTAGAVVRAFFARMSTWEWPTPVQLCQYRNADSASFAVRAWDPLTSRADRAHVMPVLTPVRPVQNTSTSVTRSTREVLRQEFWLAHCHLSRSAGVANSVAATAANLIDQHPQQASHHQQHAEDETAKLAVGSLNHLVGDSPFFAAHEMFIQVTLDATPYLNAVAALEAAVAKRRAENDGGKKEKGETQKLSQNTPTSKAAKKKAMQEAMQEEVKMQNTLYDFITGSAKKKEVGIAARSRGVEDKTESEEGSRFGRDQKARSLIEKEERLHSFVTFVESRMRDLVCHLEQCPVDEEFTKQHPQQQPFIVHPFTRPFYEQMSVAAATAEPLLSSGGGFGDSEGDSEGNAFPRAYFFLALKGMVLPSQEAVSSHAANWAEVVRSEYQFSGIALYNSGSSGSEGEGAPRPPPPAPHVDIRLVNWHALPGVVFGAENDGAGQMLSRAQAASFREAERMRMQMQMQMQMQQMQMQMHAHQMHVQNIQAQHQQHRMHQRRSSKNKGHAHHRHRKGGQDDGGHSDWRQHSGRGRRPSSGKSHNTLQHHASNKHHNHSNLEGGAGKKMRGGGDRTKKEHRGSGGHSAQVGGASTTQYGQDHHYTKSKGVGHPRRNSKSGVKNNNNNNNGNGDEKGSAVDAQQKQQQQQQKKKKKKKKRKKKSNVKEADWPVLA